MATESSYRNLLTHLHSPTNDLPLETIQASLAHHLAHAQVVTPLAAAAVSSPLFQAHPSTLAQLTSFSIALQHAVHFKLTALEEPASFGQGLFTLSLPTRLRQWVYAIVDGLQGGAPLVRLAAYGGLLVGLEDLRVRQKLMVGRDKLETETVVSLAEIMDIHYQTKTPSQYTLAWEQDWTQSVVPADGGGLSNVPCYVVIDLYVSVDVLSLALILASRSMTVISREKLRALPLGDLLQIGTSTLTSTFKSGRFLASLVASSSFQNGQIIIPVSPQLDRHMHN